MGIDYSYVCTKAKPTSTAGIFGTKTLVVCDLEFVDEHNHKLAPENNTLLVVDHNAKTAEPCQYPEDILPDDANETDWDTVQDLCDKHSDLPYGVYNEEELYGLLYGN